MLHDAIAALNRSKATILQDLAGAAALLVLLVSALSLPALF